MPVVVPPPFISIKRPLSVLAFAYLYDNGCKSLVGRKPSRNNGRVPKIGYCYRFCMFARKLCFADWLKGVIEEGRQ
ncbi:MAG TPA: hypothetical protein VFU49_15315 [Ktedonobacteraceae bacterium]|nr:hypothetical protein [Ktedonobacteraceae bacterium]